MTIDSIIQHHLPEWRKTAKKLAYPSDLWEDLLQECCIVILTKPHETISGMHERKELNWFMVRVMLNNWRSKKSPFAMKYRHLADETPHDFHNEAQEEDYDIEVDDFDRKLHDIAMEELDKLPKYKKNIFLLYTYQNKSMRELSEETGISKRTIFNTIQDVRNHFNSKANSTRSAHSHSQQLSFKL